MICTCRFASRTCVNVDRNLYEIYSIQNMNGLDKIFSHFIFLNAQVA